MRRLFFKNLAAAPGCAHLHVTRLRGPQTSAAHTQDFYEVFLVLEGAGIHHLNRRKIPLQAGHLVLVRPHDTHRFSTEGAQTLVFVNVAVSASWRRAFHTLLARPPGVAGRCMVALGTGETLRLGAELRANALTEDPLALLRVWKRVEECLTFPARDRPTSPPAWLEAVRAELAAAPDALGQPIAHWQRRSGRSPEHLARSCRRFYGVTFSELINQARVERARHLLRTTDEKVITVAFDCGFGNLANFHRVFARQTGQTPACWRLAGAATVPIHS